MRVDVGANGATRRLGNADLLDAGMGILDRKGGAQGTFTDLTGTVTDQDALVDFVELRHETLAWWLNIWRRPKTGN
jgi:hypothetical protein